MWEHLLATEVCLVEWYGERLLWRPPQWRATNLLYTVVHLMLTIFLQIIDGVLKLESPIFPSYIAICKVVTPRPDCYVWMPSLSLLPHENLNRLPYLSFYMYKMRIILPMNKISMSLSYELINVMVLDFLEESKFSTNIY